jgi:hypothetical protein
MKRECGDCQLCCKLLPVHDNEPWRKGAALDKPANTRCPHQRHRKGCAIYSDRPYACRVWTCRWLVNDDADNLPRPDRAHYVIDSLPDECRTTDNETGEIKNYLAIQVWVDPAHWTEIFTNKSLFDWLEKKAQQFGTPALLRNGSREAIGVFAPCLTGTGKWVIGEGTINPKMGLWK